MLVKKYIAGGWGIYAHQGCTIIAEESSMPADVLSIENSKSDAKLLKVFIDEAYPRHIGPGVYD
jgi:methionine synthase II (cobalamin-independent)